MRLALLTVGQTNRVGKYLAQKGPWASRASTGQRKFAKTFEGHRASISRWLPELFSYPFIPGYIMSQGNFESSEFDGLPTLMKGIDYKEPAPPNPALDMSTEPLKTGSLAGAILYWSSNVVVHETASNIVMSKLMSEY